MSRLISKQLTLKGLYSPLKGPLPTNLLAADFCNADEVAIEFLSDHSLGVVYKYWNESKKMKKTRLNLSYC